ncbi:hypothetical protein AB0M02_27505 [Actinoplanes sp. NPDC051861]|uniref:hypothetical protein n=1 Tax=Actinoplanes sp. NPDC051861 TaxID=3155170 RepID=UPI00341A4189
MAITVPAGSSLTLRCPGTQDSVMVTLAEVSAPFFPELPPIPVLSLDGPGERRFGIVELVTRSGVTWAEAELRDGLLRILGDAPADVVQRRGAARRPGTYPAAGTAQIDRAAGRRLVAVSGHVEDISIDGLLLRATADDGVPSLPSGIERTLLHVAMPWGELTAAVVTVDQRADLLRGTFEWIDADDAEQLGRFCQA